MKYELKESTARNAFAPKTAVWAQGLCCKTHDCWISKGKQRTYIHPCYLIYIGSKALDGCCVLCGLFCIQKRPSEFVFVVESLLSGMDSFVESPFHSQEKRNRKTLNARLVVLSGCLKRSHVYLKRILDMLPE